MISSRAPDHRLRSASGTGSCRVKSTVPRFQLTRNNYRDMFSRNSSDEDDWDRDSLEDGGGKGKRRRYNSQQVVSRLTRETESSRNRREAALATSVKSGPSRMRREKSFSSTPTREGSPGLRRDHSMSSSLSSFHGEAFGNIRETSVPLLNSGRLNNRSTRQSKTSVEVDRHLDRSSSSKSPSFEPPGYEPRRSSPRWKTKHEKYVSGLCSSPKFLSSESLTHHVNGTSPSGSRSRSVSSHYIQPGHFRDSPSHMWPSHCDDHQSNKFRVNVRLHPNGSGCFDKIRSKDISSSEHATDTHRRWSSRIEDDDIRFDDSVHSTRSDGLRLHKSASAEVHIKSPERVQAFCANSRSSFPTMVSPHLPIDQHRYDDVQPFSADSRASVSDRRDNEAGVLWNQTNNRHTRSIAVHSSKHGDATGSAGPLKGVDVDQSPRSSAYLDTERPHVELNGKSDNSLATEEGRNGVAKLERHDLDGIIERRRALRLAIPSNQNNRSQPGDRKNVSPLKVAVDFMAHLTSTEATGAASTNNNVFHCDIASGVTGSDVEYRRSATPEYDERPSKSLSSIWEKTSTLPRTSKLTKALSLTRQLIGTKTDCSISFINESCQRDQVMKCDEFSPVPDSVTELITDNESQSLTPNPVIISASQKQQLYRFGKSELNGGALNSPDLLVRNGPQKSKWLNGYSEFQSRSNEATNTLSNTSISSESITEIKSELDLEGNTVPPTIDDCVPEFRTVFPESDGESPSSHPISGNKTRSPELAHSNSEINSLVADIQTASGFHPSSVHSNRVDLKVSTDCVVNYVSETSTASNRTSSGECAQQTPVSNGSTVNYSSDNGGVLNVISSDAGVSIDVPSQEVIDPTKLGPANKAVQVARHKPRSGSLHGSPMCRSAIPQRQLKLRVSSGHMKTNRVSTPTTAVRDPCKAPSPYRVRFADEQDECDDRRQTPERQQNSEGSELAADIHGDECKIEEEPLADPGRWTSGAISADLECSSDSIWDWDDSEDVSMDDFLFDKDLPDDWLEREVDKMMSNGSVEKTAPSASMLPPQNAPLPVSASPLHKLHDSLPAAAALPASAAVQPSSGQLGIKPHRPSAAVVAVVRPEQKSSSAAAATSSTPSSAENPHQIDLRQQDQLLQRDRSIDQLLKESATLKEEISRIRTRNQRTIKLADMSARAFLRLAARNDRLHADNRRAVEVVTAERTEARDELVKMESLFSDLNRKFEKSRTMISESKQRSELVTVQLQEAMASLATEQQRYQILQQHSEDTFQSLKAEKDAMVHSSELETLRLTTKLRLAENKTNKLEQENQELTALCDELIQKMGGTP